MSRALIRWAKNPPEIVLASHRWDKIKCSFQHVCAIASTSYIWSAPDHFVGIPPNCHATCLNLTSGQVPCAIPFKINLSWEKSGGCLYSILSENARLLPIMSVHWLQYWVRTSIQVRKYSTPDLYALNCWSKRVSTAARNYNLLRKTIATLMFLWQVYFKRKFQLKPN